MRTILTNGQIVTPNGIIQGNIVIDPPFIESVGNDYVAFHSDTIIDLHHASVMPGVIDTHVHFREPGMTHKATIATESRAAAAGGVTSVLEMPNCKPTTTTAEALRQKQDIAKHTSVINHAFFIGATQDNTVYLHTVDYTQVPGIKVFMGSSTGGMLLDNADVLRQVFSISPTIPIVTHCEDTDIINRNAEIYGDTDDFSKHPIIRSREACIKSTGLAIHIAKECGTRLHIAHISTKEEVEMIKEAASKQISAEACLPHILFNDNDYHRLKSRIKCNPAIKTYNDQEAIIKALRLGIISTVATDHAPHLLSEKMAGGCLTSPSGMPMVQFSLPAMIQKFGYLMTAQLLSHNPAQVFHIHRRGTIQPGNYADLVIVKEEDHLVQDNDVISLCKWTPMAGHTLNHRVCSTYINGQIVYDGQSFINTNAKMALRFEHTSL